MEPQPASLIPCVAFWIFSTQWAWDIVKVTWGKHRHSNNLKCDYKSTSKAATASSTPSARTQTPCTYCSWQHHNRHLSYMFHFNYSTGAMKLRPANTSLFTLKSLYKCRTLIQTPLAFGMPEGFEPNLGCGVISSKFETITIKGNLLRYCRKYLLYLVRF